MKRKFLIISILTLFIISSFPISHARTFSVGVSPPVIDLGEIEKGKSKIGRFYIVTPSDEELLVNLETMKGNIDFFKNDYKNFVFNYSEEDTSKWVEFLRNPVILKPSGELKTNGGTIKGWREIEFVLNVPENAEPGYHTIIIRPLPRVPTREGWGVTIRAVTTVTILFKVPGRAIREGRILDTSSGNYVGNSLEVNVFFQNTGTTTIYSHVKSIKISDEYGRAVGSLSSNADFVEPGETKTFKTLWDIRGLDFGSYNANTTVCYITGCTSKQSVIELYVPITPPMVIYPEERPFSWLTMVIIILILVIAYIIYRRRE